MAMASYTNPVMLYFALYLFEIFLLFIYLIHVISIRVMGSNFVPV